MIESSIELTPKEYATERRLHFQTVYKLLREGKIDGAVKIGRSWRIAWNRPLVWVELKSKH